MQTATARAVELIDSYLDVNRDADLAMVQEWLGRSIISTKHPYDKRDSCLKTARRSMFRINNDAKLIAVPDSCFLDSGDRQFSSNRQPQEFRCWPRNLGIPGRISPSGSISDTQQICCFYLRELECRERGAELFSRHMLVIDHDRGHTSL